MNATVLAFLKRQRNLAAIAGDLGWYRLAVRAEQEFRAIIRLNAAKFADMNAKAVTL